MPLPDARDQVIVTCAALGTENGEAPANVLSQRGGWSKSRKWILTISLGLLFPLLTIAFLSQSARWPETDFEHILLWSGVLAGYSGVLWMIWK